MPEDRLSNIETAVLEAAESIDLLTAALIYTWSVKLSMSQQGVSANAHDIMAGAVNGVVALYAKLDEVRREFHKNEV